jgi:hypothetical protein
MIPISGRQFFASTPPRSVSLSSGQAPYTPTANTGPGLIAVIATSTVAAALDLTQLFAPPYNSSQGSQQSPGLPGNMISIFADTTDVGLLFGPTLASVTGANVPALAAAGTVNASGIYTLSGKECWRIATGTLQRFLLGATQKKAADGTVFGGDNFLGFVSTGAGLIRVFQSSPSNP